MGMCGVRVRERMVVEMASWPARCYVNLRKQVGWEGKAGGGFTSGAVASDGQLGRQQALALAVLEYPLDDGVALLVLRREAGFGRECVLGEDDGGAGLDAEVAHDAVVGVHAGGSVSKVRIVTFFKTYQGPRKRGGGLTSRQSTRPHASR